MREFTKLVDLQNLVFSFMKVRNSKSLLYIHDILVALNSESVHSSSHHFVKLIFEKQKTFNANSPAL